MDMTITSNSCDTLWGFFFRNFFTTYGGSDAVTIRTEDMRHWIVTLYRSKYPHVTGYVVDDDGECDEVCYVDQGICAPRNCTEMFYTVQKLVGDVQNALVGNAENVAYPF